jgi:hypothetical protein
VEISLTFNNTGTVNITGVAIARIVDSAAHLVEEFIHNVSDLTPSESISFSAVWNTSEAEEGSYDVIGYVRYDGKATATATAAVQTYDLKPPSISTVSQEPQMSGVRNVTLSYSTDAGETWTNASMEWTTGDIYEGEIPGLPAGTNVKYQIIAYDYANKSATEDNAGAYYIYLVIPEFAAWTLLLIIFIVFTAAIVTHKRRLLKTPIR